MRYKQSLHFRHRSLNASQTYLRVRPRERHRIPSEAENCQVLVGLSSKVVNSSNPSQRRGRADCDLGTALDACTTPRSSASRG